jgi:hypothetical protein
MSAPAPTVNQPGVLIPPADGAPYGDEICLFAVAYGELAAVREIILWSRDRGLVRTPAASFDHFISAAEQRKREGEAERLGGLHVKPQLDFRYLLHWQITRLFAL